MAIKKIDDYNAVTTPATTDTVVVTQGGITRKETIAQVQTILKATDAQTVAATSTTCFVTPSSLSSRTATSTATGLVELATDAEGIAGTDDGRALTAANLKAVLQGLLYAVNMSKGTDITSAERTNISAATGNTPTITGSTTITSFGTAITGTRRTLIFDGTPALAYNATSLQLPGNANLTMAAGDVAECLALGGENWKVLDVFKTNGTAISVATGSNKNFYAYQAAGQSINTSTWTKVTIDTELIDTNNVFDAATNYRIVIPNGETWHLFGRVVYNNGTTIAMKSAIYKNGNLIAFNGIAGLTAAGQTHYAMNASGLYVGNGTDYYELYTWQNYGSAISLEYGEGYTAFGGFKIK